MNTLSSIVLETLAQAPAPKAKDTSAPWFGDGGVFEWWQVILFFVLIGLIIFYVIYKKKQREQE
jgi:hypothetical protein